MLMMPRSGLLRACVAAAWFPSFPKNKDSPFIPLSNCQVVLKEWLHPCFLLKIKQGHHILSIAEIVEGTCFTIYTAAVKSPLPTRTLFLPSN